MSRETVPSTPSGNRATLVAGGGALVIGGLLAALSRVRWYDRDEGFYAMAAALVRAGRHPWRDFAYPQGPLLPFLLAPLGTEMAGLRWLSVALSAALVFLLLRRVTTRHGATTGVATALLLLACPFFTSWMPTLKTYAPAGLLSAGALLLLTSGARRWDGPRGEAARGALVGLLVGLAAAIRVPCLVLAPLGAAWLALDRPTPERRRGALLLGGVTLALVAAACGLTGASPAQMALNALRAGLLVNPHPWRQRLTTLGEYARDPAVLLLVGLGLAGLALSWRARSGPSAAPRRADHELAAVVAATLTLGYLMALPTFTQYFTFAVPFWAWAAAPLWARVAAWRPPARAAVWAALVATCALSALLYGERSRRSPYPWQAYFAPAEVTALRAALAAHVPAGTPTLATWPGFLAGSAVKPWPGLESTVSFDLAAHLPPARRALVPFVSVDEVRALLAAGTPAAVVLTTEDQEWYHFDPTRLPAYEVVHASERVVLLVRRGGAGGR